MSERPSKIRLGCMLLLALTFALTLSGGVGYIALTSYDTLVSRPESAPTTWVIHDTTVVDVVDGTLAEHVDVRIEGTTIAAIAATADPPANVTVVDGRGKFVVPGLIDMHCHVLWSPAPAWAAELPIPELNFEQLLFAGVTRVFDPGDLTPDIFEARQQIATGELLGPTIHAAGPIFGAVGGHPVPALESTLPEVIASSMIDSMARQIASPRDAERAVAELAGQKPDFIKLVVDAIPEESPRLARGLPKAIVEAARSHDLRPVAHIGNTHDAIVAADAGVAAWIHGVYREEIPPEQIAKIASYQIPMTPTLTVFKSYAELGQERRSTALERQMTDPELLDEYERIPDDYETTPGLQGFVDVVRAQRENGLRNAGRLHEAGVRILAGSDQQSGLVPGASLHRELALLQKAGLSPIEVLRATTLYAAQFLADSDDPGFGLVAEGKRADLVLINANPLKDAKHLSDIDTVILGGVALERHPLEAE